MIRAGVTDAGGGLVGVDCVCDRNLKRSRGEYCAPTENGVFHQKSIKAKSRRASVAERAAASPVAANAARNGLAALESGAVQDAAVWQERQRISRDLHDHAGQYLVGIALRLAALEQTIADPSTSHAFAELRQLLDRFCHEL